MGYILRKSLVVATLLALVGCRDESPSSISHGEGAAPAKRFEKIRGPAVAGLFYSNNAGNLEREVDRLLDLADSEPIQNLRALVCPHAGYQFSAVTAAIGYKQLMGQNISTVILLGPSHYAAFQGAFVSTADAYQTPLGMVPISPKAAELAKIKPFTADPRCNAVRPAWQRQSPKKPPPAGEDTPETWEHSLEVQLPFLQRTLHDFSIVPIVFGRVDPRKVADGLIPLLDDRTIIVVSTDLSHYHPYEKARAMDARCVKAICDLDASKITDENACGYAPILTLIDIARRKGWKARRLDYRNSGDVSGDKSRVVGYAAIAFFTPNASATDEAPQFTPAQRQFLLKLARKSVTAAVVGGEPPNEDADVPKEFQTRLACFVTLTKNSNLRGCIGGIFPQESLYKAVIRRAKSAAIEDSRFPPVRGDELKRIEVEISVLTVPKPLRFTSPQELLAKLRPGIDGVVLSAGGRGATFLPQVWEQLPDRRLFLAKLAAKAGLAPNAWTLPDASVMTYQVEAFKEEGGRRRAENEK